MLDEGVLKPMLVPQTDYREVEVRQEAARALALFACKREGVPRPPAELPRTLLHCQAPAGK